MRYLSKEEILLINRLTIKVHGGNFVGPSNFHNEQSLDYLLEAVRSKLFGQEIYPTLSHKAGLYMFNIVSNHTFQDGNKRTGLGAALLFLKLNGYQLKTQLTEWHGAESSHTDSTELLIEFTLNLAAGNIQLDVCQNWFEANIQVLK